MSRCSHWIGEVAKDHPLERKLKTKFASFKLTLCMHHQADRRRAQGCRLSHRDQQQLGQSLKVRVFVHPNEQSSSLH